MSDETVPTMLSPQVKALAPFFVGLIPLAVGAITMSNATRQTSPQTSDALKSTAEVGNLLGISPTRVNQLIHAKELDSAV